MSCFLPPSAGSRVATQKLQQRHTSYPMRLGSPIPGRGQVKTKSSRSRLPARGLKTLVGTKPASGDVRNIPISAYAKTCAPRFYSEEGNRWLRNTSGLGKPTSIDMLRAIQGERKLTEGQEVEFEFGAHGGKRASCSEFSVGCKNPQPAARFHLSTFARI